MKTKSRWFVKKNLFFAKEIIQTIGCSLTFVVMFRGTKASTKPLGHNFFKRSLCYTGE
jgi:hypothetical protein